MHVCTIRQSRHLSEISLTVQESLDIRPAFDRIHQLGQPRISLQPSPSVLRQLLIMTNLIDDKIRVRDLLTDHKSARLRQLVGRQMLLQRLEEIIARSLLVLRIRLLLVGVEKRDDEQRAPYQSSKLTSANNLQTSKMDIVLQSAARSHIASTQYFSSSLSPSYAPS